MKMGRLMGSICVVLVLAALIGCFGAGLVPDDDGDGTTAADGTLTVSLSGANLAEGETLLAYAYQAGEWIVDMQEYVLGAGFAVIAADGTAQFVLTDSIDTDWNPTGDAWTATGGENYDLYIYTHSGGDSPMDWVLTPWAKTVTVDGDTTVAVNFSDFVAYEPTAGTLTVSVSGAQEQVGKQLHFQVYASGADPVDSNPMAFGAVEIQSDGTASAVVQTQPLALMAAPPDPEDWTGAAGGEYDVYIFVDADNSGVDGLTDGDPIYMEYPVTYWQYGNKVMPTRYEDYAPVFVPPVG